MTDDSFFDFESIDSIIIIYIYIYNNNLLILFLFLKLSSVICHMAIS